ncbi:MAG: surface lipoprotein [Gammaproteobacteria bacterium HGW-Gammaproteobacteria-6]|nr:MAG: surface lipoprotein [Gammaproteobacteria bacterium HGW-Gammaproteobacteria-6]
MTFLRSVFLLLLFSPVVWAQVPVATSVPDGYEAPTREIAVKDPWENYNRGMHKFNRAVDDNFAKPIAKGYKKITPQPIRTGISNFFTNLFQPLSAVHLLLQGRPGAAGAALGRFAINATLGIGGLFDPATDAGIPLRREDLGQTFAVWGWGNSRYFELPFLGPSTLRDAFGFAGDFQVSPFNYVERPERYYVFGLYLIDLRAGALAGEKLVRGGDGDDYTLIRDAYMQNRDFQIHDRTARDQLPDYLQEDDSLDEDE